MSTSPHIKPEYPQFLSTLPHGHPARVKLEPITTNTNFCNHPAVSTQDIMEGPLPENLIHLPSVELVAANDSPLMMTSGWLLLSNMANTNIGLPRSTANLVKLPKLVVLRYVGEGDNSRLFLVKQGPDERLLKLYHGSHPSNAEADAYEILDQCEDPRLKTVKVTKLAPAYLGETIASYAAHGVQVRHYGILTEYIRSESISDAARKLNSQAIDELENQLKTMLNCLHRAGIVHKNLTASNILLDDPTRYQSSLEFKPLSKSGVQPRFVGFSNATFEKNMDKIAWDALRREDRSQLQGIFAVVRQQNDTTAALKLVKRITGDEKQEKLRQRGLVRALSEADAFDNELSSGLQTFQKPGYDLALSIAILFTKGNRHETALEFLQKHSVSSADGERADYVRMHVMIAEALVKLEKPKAEIEAAWELAIELSKESMGLASSITIIVRRKHARWIFGAGQPDRGAGLFARILTDVIGYHQRGTGNEMSEDNFMLSMRKAVSDMKLQCAKGPGSRAVHDGSTRAVLTGAFEQWADFVDAIDRGKTEQREQREAAEAAKAERTACAKASSAAKRPAEVEGNDKEKPAPAKKAKRSRKAA